MLNELQTKKIVHILRFHLHKIQQNTNYPRVAKSRSETGKRRRKWKEKEKWREGRDERKTFRVMGMFSVLTVVMVSGIYI